MEEVSIPNDVRELCDDCFSGCGSLRRVNFGPSSSPERIGVLCVLGSGVSYLCDPVSV